MLDAGHRQIIRAALGVYWQRNFTNDKANSLSGLLPFSQTLRKCRLRLIYHSMHVQFLSITTLRLMLKILNVVFSVRRVQGRTWNLAKNLQNDLSAIGYNIDDAISFNFPQFTRLVDSFHSKIYYCWTLQYIYIYSFMWTWWWHVSI